MQHSFGCH